jgi:RNA polymerase-binding transcription factor DksA
MYLGDRHINFDRYYDAPDYDDEPETEEEIAAAQAQIEAEQKQLADVDVAWVAAGKLCKCGRPIGFVEFMHEGICNACFDEAMSAMGCI